MLNRRSFSEEEEGAPQGYNVTLLTTSSVEGLGCSILERELREIRGKSLQERCEDFYTMAPEIYFRNFKEDYMYALSSSVTSVC